MSLNRNIRIALIASTSAIAVSAGAVSVASAQQTAGPSVEEVIVTASRRSENSQRTALALAVVSGDTLTNAGVSKPEDVNKLVPSLKMTNAATTSIYIRGVGENSAQQNSQSAIAVSVDGVYIGRTSAVGGNFYDLERVEVLKGPQGTLYGRNASGGALNIITAKPTAEFGGTIIGELGNYDLRRMTGAINVPVTDELKLRAAFFDSKRGGYLSDGFQDEDIRAARIHALWTPTDGVRLLVTADGSQIGGLGEGASLKGTGRQGANQTPAAKAARVANKIPTFGTPHSEISNNSLSANLDVDLGFATLTVQPGYRRQNFHSYGETSSGSTLTYGESHQYTGEIRLGNQGERFKYVVGLYYFDEAVEYLYNINTVSGAVVNHSIQDVDGFNTQSKAVFGEATYNLTDRLRLTGGARYTNEHREFDMYARWYGPNYSFPHTNIADPRTGVVPPLTAPDPITGIVQPLYTYHNVGSPTFKNTSGKIGFEFDVAPRSLLYGTIATGFKSGGFSIAPPPTNVFQPEELTAYTLGSKNRFFEGALQANVELFNWDYKNQQIAHLGYDINGASGFVTDNAGSSKIYGVNFDIQWAMTRSDTFGVNVEFLNTETQEYLIKVPANPAATATAEGCKLTPAGTVNGRPISTQDCSGFPLPYAPEYSGAINYSHVFDLGEIGEVVFGASAQFAAETPLAFDKRPQNKAPAYFSPDFDLTYRTVERNLSLTAYVRNANDELIFNTINTSVTPNLVGLRAPRTYGLRLMAKF